MFTNHIYLIHMNKPDLALNNQQWLICHKTKPNQTKDVQYFSQILSALDGVIFGGIDSEIINTAKLSSKILLLRIFPPTLYINVYDELLCLSFHSYIYMCVDRAINLMS